MEQRFTRLAELFGGKCIEVCFILDYVNIWFGEDGLQCVSLPEVEYHGRRWLSSSDGWRDALCELIGDEVKDVAADNTTDELELTFNSGRRVALRRDPDHSNWEVWNEVHRPSRGASALSDG